MYMHMTIGIRIYESVCGQGQLTLVKVRNFTSLKNYPICNLSR